MERADPEVACQDGVDNDGGRGVGWNRNSNTAPADSHCVDAPFRDHEATFPLVVCGLGFEVVPFVAIWPWLRERKRRNQRD